MQMNLPGGCKPNSLMPSPSILRSVYSSIEGLGIRLQAEGDMGW